jgi:uncharacterized protein involved in exopolysaccharide biosynthesis
MNVASDRVAYADFVDMRRVYTHIILNRWWILACVITATAAFSAVAFLTRPMYQVTAVLMPETTERGMNLTGLASSSLASLASGFGIGGPANPGAEEALAVLQSREFTEKFIADENLLPQLFPRKWNASAHLWKVPPDERPTLAEAYEYFDKKIRTITDDRQTGLVTLKIEWTNPKEAADWANELIHLLNQEMRTRAITKADAALLFLNSQLQKTSTVEVRNALGYLMEAQLKKRMIAQVTPDYSLQFVAPPVGSDGAKPVWPKKILLLVLGPPVGLVIGLLLTLFWQNGLREEE